MASFPHSITRPLAGGAFTLLIALGAATAHAQVVPKPVPTGIPSSQNVAYYVDGKSATEATMKEIKPDDIQAINVLKGAQAQSLGLSGQQQGAVLVTTKAGASSPEVMAFNQRFPTREAEPATPEQNAALAAARAYIAKQYPTAKLEAVFVAPNQTDRYKALFTNNGQRVYLLFDGKGNPVER